MSNSSSATKMAIARLTGSDLPIFVPDAIAKDLADLVRGCILQPENSKRLRVTSDVHEEIVKHLARYHKPKYTVPQYILILLYTVSTTSDLIDRHDRGLISDKEFIKQVKNGKDNNGAKKSSEVGRKKGKSNASDRSVLPREIHQGTNTEIS